MFRRTAARLPKVWTRDNPTTQSSKVAVSWKEQDKQFIAYRNEYKKHKEDYNTDEGEWESSVSEYPQLARRL